MTTARIFFLLSIIVLLPDVALAAPWVHGSFIGQDLCDIAGSMVGELASAIAMIAICSIGVMACIGRVQWSTVLVTTVGIVILFGAVQVANQIGQSLGSVAVDAKGGCN